MKHSKGYNNHGRRISCIFIDGEIPCENDTKYIVDVFTVPDENGSVSMPLIDFECCEKHLRWAAKSDNHYILKNIHEKDKQHDTNQ